MTLSAWEELPMTALVTVSTIQPSPVPRLRPSYCNSWFTLVQRNPFHLFTIFWALLLHFFFFDVSNTRNPLFLEPLSVLNVRAGYSCWTVPGHLRERLPWGEL